MKRYIVQRYYHSDYATYQAGDVIELDDDTAAWLNRDSPGVIAEVVPPEPEPVPEPEPETRIAAAPPADRMVR